MMWKLPRHVDTRDGQWDKIVSVDSDRYQPGIMGVGYQGQTIEQFVTSLESMDIACVVDVRLTPLSRKPGFSKAGLMEALTARGISYEHVRTLGNPKDNREGFAGDAQQLEAARSRYVGELDAKGAWTLLEELAVRAQTQRLALLCFEADGERCHRQVLLDKIQDWLIPSDYVSA